MKSLNIDLETATIQQLHQLLVTNKLTGGEAVADVLAADRRPELEEGPSLNAVRVINPDWYQEAVKVDKERAKGIDLGPMMGIPVLVKDNIDVEGLPTTAGSVALAHSYPADDAPLIKQLKAAGAIILGKTNMAEFALPT